MKSGLIGEKVKEDEMGGCCDLINLLKSQGRDDTMKNMSRYGIKKRGRNLSEGNKKEDR